MVDYKIGNNYVLVNGVGNDRNSVDETVLIDLDILSWSHIYNHEKFKTNEYW